MIGRRLARITMAGLALLTSTGDADAQGPPPSPPAPATQQPSPMVERTRAHARLVERTPAGTVDTLPGPNARPILLFVPARAARADRVDLVIHFHGAPWIAAQAVAPLRRPTVSATMTLGAGSGVYDRSYRDPAALDTLLADLTQALRARRGGAVHLDRVVLSGWSAGHGAIRAILREPRHALRVHGVLLLDGLHTSYVPEGTVLSEGGLLDTTNLVALTTFARRAMQRETRMLVTHSEIFPGSYASTTETADWMIAALGERRTPVLRWGPRGMQQLSEVRAGAFEVIGYAGNTAPDHVDQLHAMPELLARLLRR
jgi:hypothetical protein